jgi:hypothetical protein
MKNMSEKRPCRRAAPRRCLSATIPHFEFVVKIFMMQSLERAVDVKYTGT